MSFPVWKTLILGKDAKNAADFERLIKGKGMRIGDYAIDIFSKPEFKVADREQEVDLVRVSVEQMGFAKEEVTRQEIYRRAIKLGLELCPCEVGPALRLSYEDQPDKEWLFIGMETIADSQKDMVIFRVGNGDGNLWLRCYCSNTGNTWRPHSVTLRSSSGIASASFLLTNGFRSSSPRAEALAI